LTESSDPAFSLRVRFGATEAGELVKNLTTKSSIREIASAELELDLDPAFVEPLELFSEVVITVAREGGTEEPLFTGHVIESSHTGQRISLKLSSGAVLTERNVSPMWSERVGAAEIIYSTLRDAGFPDDRLRIQGIDELEEEIVEVCVPILGIDLDSRVRVGRVTFLPGSSGLASIAGCDVPTPLAELMAATSEHALFITRAAHLRDAEKQAIDEIDVVLAWLRVHGHYGLIHRPSGHPQDFTRERAMSHPRRGEVVAVRGLTSRRRWVRVPEDRTPPPNLRLDDEPLPPALPVSLTLAERQALIACQRAAAEGDTIAASTALSDTLEFYTAGVAAPPLFEQAELEGIKRSLPHLAPHKKKVVTDAIGRLNSSPLKRRLIEASARDRAPLSREEVNLLWKIRGARNAAVHGKGGEPPAPQDITYATSIIARLLAFRIERRLRGTVDFTRKGSQG
jgi:hypothetical protein